MEADLMVTCPYNPAHRIAQYKYMSHVSKCKKSAKKNTVENKVQCPLDSSHIVDNEDLNEHIATCPSLGSLVVESVENIKQEDLVVDSYRSTENWDEEPEVPSYNPMEVSANKQVVRCVSGLSKAEKKKYRDSERMRIAILNQKGAIKTTTRTTSVANSSVPEELPLRPPTSTPAIFQETETTQDDFDNSQTNNTLDSSIQCESTNDFQDLFYKKLYDQLAPDSNDTNQQLSNQTGHSLYSTDMGACALDYSQGINKEKKNHKMTKAQLNETFEINVDNLNRKEKNEYVISKGSERADKNFSLLKSKENNRKSEEIRNISENDKDSIEKGLKWAHNAFDQLNAQITYLTDIQNVAAEETARLLKQLNELKLRENKL